MPDGNTSPGPTWPMFNGTPDVIDAWRQLHHGAQIAAEAAKGWGDERPDDSHSAFEWDASLARLQSVPIRGNTPFRATMDFSPLRIALIDASGNDLASLLLAGQTAQASLRWIRTQCETFSGEPARQPSRPAPDLPAHPIAQGAPFDPSADAAFTLVRDLYGAGASMLEGLRNDLPDRPEVRCWPHHFDLALLHVRDTDGDGQMTRTMGVGLAVPDDGEPDGYIYVSPWSREGGIDGASRAPELRWSGPMAVLPLTELDQHDDDARSHRVRTFCARAVHACLDALSA